MTSTTGSKQKTGYLLVGGAGYIGKTVYHTLKSSNTNQIQVYDNLSTGTSTGISNLIVGEVKNIAQQIAVPKQSIKQSIPDEADGLHVGEDLTVLMFAGSKSIAESVANPSKYWQNNVGSLMHLLEWMKARGLYKLVFSSSATVYGQPQYLPLDEAHPLSALNPYGESKLACEQLLRYVAKTDSRWRIGILRYFNPVGAWTEVGHGETPVNPPPNLVPFMAQVAAGKREKLMIYGNDYQTVDGTGVRDYLHVRDLADAHVRMCEYLDRTAIDCTEVNLGVGRGFSVMEVLACFKMVSGKRIPYEIVGRRAGDAASVYCDPTKARALLGWSADRTLYEMCESEWKWQLCN